MKAKAAILHQLNAPLVVDEIEIPPLDIGQVLVQVMSSGICGAQLSEIAGAAGPDPHLPHLLGHEGAGIVEEIGPGVTQVKPGDRVVLHWRVGKGIEAPFPRYQRGDRIIGGGRVTTFNNYAVISENRLTVYRPDVPSEVAALMGCAVTTALGLINREAQLEIGQSIAVAGVGGVGMSIVYAANLIGGHPIVAIDQTLEKVSLAKCWGATHRFFHGEDWIQQIRDISPQGVDVFVDCTASPAIIEQGFNLTRPGGRMILVGQPFHHHTLVLGEFRQHYRGKTLLDSQGGLTNPTVDIPRYLEMYCVGKLYLEDMITHRYPLDEINEALDMVRLGLAGRVMVEMGC